MEWGSMERDSIDCESARRALFDTRPGDEPPEVVHFHLARCSDCRDEIAELRSIDETLAEAFANAAESISPSEDRIAMILRATTSSPEIETVRKTSRSVSKLLWTAFFLLTLLGGLSVLAVAYHRLSP